MKRRRLHRLLSVLFILILFVPALLSAEGSVPPAKTAAGDSQVESESAVPEPTPVFVEIYSHVNEIHK